MYTGPRWKWNFFFPQFPRVKVFFFSNKSKKTKEARLLLPFMSRIRLTVSNDPNQWWLAYRVRRWGIRCLSQSRPKNFTGRGKNFLGRFFFVRGLRVEKVFGPARGECCYRKRTHLSTYSVGTVLVLYSLRCYYSEVRRMGGDERLSPCSWIESHPRSPPCWTLSKVSDMTIVTR